jgi:hypothetical protein
VLRPLKGLFVRVGGTYFLKGLLVRVVANYLLKVLLVRVGVSCHKRRALH